LLNDEEWRGETELTGSGVSQQKLLGFCSLLQSQEISSSMESPHPDVELPTAIEEAHCQTPHDCSYKGMIRTLLQYYVATHATYAGHVFACQRSGICHLTIAYLQTVMLYTSSPHLPACTYLRINSHIPTIRCNLVELCKIPRPCLRRCPSLATRP
jgi:hypothetical protein